MSILQASFHATVRINLSPFPCSDIVLDILYLGSLCLTVVLAEHDCRHQPIRRISSVSPDCRKRPPQKHLTRGTMYRVHIVFPYMSQS